MGGLESLGGHVVVGDVGSVADYEGDFFEVLQFVAGHLGQVLRRLESEVATGHLEIKEKEQRRGDT